MKNYVNKKNTLTLTRLDVQFFSTYPKNNTYKDENLSLKKYAYVYLSVHIVI